RWSRTRCPDHQRVRVRRGGARFSRTYHRKEAVSGENPHALAFCSVGTPTAGTPDPRTECRGPTVSIRSKRAQVDIPLFGPEGSTRHAVPAQSDILADADRRPDQRFASTDARQKLCGFALVAADECGASTASKA